MADQQQETEESPALFEKVSQGTPAILLVASGLYALGLYAAFRMDSSLGVGPIQVTRERAVGLGIVQLLVLSPLFLFWFSVKESLIKCSDGKAIVRLKATLIAAWLPAILIIFMVALFLQVFGVTQTTPMVVSMAFPIVAVSFLLVNSSSNARRIVFTWPIFLIFCVPFAAGTVSSWLPFSFGGHVGPDVIVRMKDKSTFRGKLLTGDSTVLVISTQMTNISISRSEVLTIESIAPRK